MSKSPHPAPLNPRQLLFVEHYLIDLNGKEAAIRAGYSRSRAAARGYALLRLPQIRAAIAEAMARRAGRCRDFIAGGITPERVLEEYARIAFSDWRHFADWGPRHVRFAAMRALSRDDRAAVAEIVEASGGLRRVKLFDKQAALTSLSRILAEGDRARFAGAAPRPSAAAPALPPSARQRRFAEEYLTDFNAYAAARRAGYSDRTAALNMTKMKRHPATAALIAALIETRSEPIRIEADRVLEEYARIAFADIGRVADWNNKRLHLKPPRRVARDDSAAIERIDATRDGSLRLTLHDKVYALDMLARHLGLLDQRVPGGALKRKYAARRTSAALRARLGR